MDFGGVVSGVGVYRLDIVHLIASTGPRMAKMSLEIFDRGGHLLWRSS